MSQLSGFMCDCVNCRVAELTPCPCSEGGEGEEQCPESMILCDVPRYIWEECQAAPAGEPLTVHVQTELPDGGPLACCYTVHCGDRDCPEGAPQWNDVVFGVIPNCDVNPCCSGPDIPCDKVECCENRPTSVRYKLEYSMAYSMRGDILEGQDCGQYSYCQTPSIRGGPAFCGGPPAPAPPVAYWADNSLRAITPTGPCEVPSAPTPGKWKCLKPDCSTCQQLETCVSCGAPGNPQNPEYPQVAADGLYGVVEYDMQSPSMEYINCETVLGEDGIEVVVAHYQGYGNCKIPITYLLWQCIGQNTQTATSTPFVPGCSQGWSRMGCDAPAGVCPGCTPAAGQPFRSANGPHAWECTTSVEARGYWYCSIGVPNNPPYCQGNTVTQSVRFEPDYEGGEDNAIPWSQSFIWNVPDGVDARQGCTGISSVYVPAQEWKDTSGSISDSEAEQLFDYYGYIEQVLGVQGLPHMAVLGGSQATYPFGCGSPISPDTPILNWAPHVLSGNVTGPNYMYIDYGASKKAYGYNYICSETGTEKFDSDGRTANVFRKKFASGIVAG